MARATLDPSEHTRIDTKIGLLVQDQRTGDFRRVVYVDSRVVLVRDEDGNTTLIDRESFEAELGTRYRPRPDAANVDIEAGQYDRLRERFTVYEHRDGRKAAHMADALREAFDLLPGGVGDLDDELRPELPDDAGESADDASAGNADDAGDGPENGGVDELPFEEVPGIGPETAGKLRTSGYVTERDVRTADDDELLAVAGVGPSNLENLRAFLD